MAFGYSRTNSFCQNRPGPVQKVPREFGPLLRLSSNSGLYLAMRFGGIEQLRLYLPIFQVFQQKILDDIFSRALGVKYNLYS
mgnify:CR=1 FL=1